MSEKNDFPTMSDTKVAVAVGRFQPPTVGHYAVFSRMTKEIAKYNKSHEKGQISRVPIVLIIDGEKSSKDKTVNPLTVDERIKIMRGSGHLDDKTIFITGKNLVDGFKNVRRAGYEPCLIVGGDDRGTKSDAPYKNLLDKYFTTPDGKSVEHIYVSIKRNDAKEQSIATQNTLLKMIEKDGDVDPTTISGTIARKAAELGYKNAFTAILGLKNKQHIADIAYNKIRKGLSDV